MNLVLVVRGRIARQSVENAEGLRSDQPAANVGEGAEVSRIEILTDRERAAELRTQMPRRRTREVMVDLVVDDASFGDTTTQCRAGAIDRTPLEARVVGDVRAQRVIELQPIGRHIRGIEIAERTIRLLVVDFLIQREEGIAEDAILSGGRSIGVG